MNLPLKVAQAKVGPSSPGEAPRVISLTKPQDNQAVVGHLKGAIRADLSAMGDEVS